LRRTRRDYLTEGALNALLDAFPLDAWAHGLRAAVYAGLPDGWLRRDAAGVRMIVIGGWA
jgi:hypothetical protein